jgi:hypothetical protein
MTKPPEQCFQEKQQVQFQRPQKTLLSRCASTTQGEKGKDAANRLSTVPAENMPRQAQFGQPEQPCFSPLTLPAFFRYNYS